MNHHLKFIQKTGKEIPLRVAINEASTLWKDLPANTKSKYRRNHNCNSAVPAFKKRELIEMAMRDDISIHLRVTVKNNDIRCTTFLICSFNYFFITDPEKLHVPAEVSVCAYSMNEGLIKIYSKQLNPQTDVFGSYYLAQEHSEETHKLPIPPKGMGTVDLKKVYADIIKFLQNYSDETSQNSRALPPLYTKIEHLTVVKSCLAYLRHRRQPKILVYSIENLGDELKTMSKKVTIYESMRLHSCEKLFEKDIYEYEQNLACPYHEKVDRVRYCTQHQVIRWSYILSEYLSKFFDINMILMKHYPESYERIKNIVNAISNRQDNGDNEDSAKCQNGTETGKSDYFNDENSRNNDCRNDIDGSSKNRIYVTDILKVIDAGNRQPKNKPVKKVSEYLLTQWNTKAPNAKLFGCGRGHS